MNKKIIATVGACALCLGLGVAGTLAWLTDTTGEVKNTFTTSDIDITLVETNPEDDNDPANNTYHMIPGNTLSKDPTITVTKNSEKCYVFLKVSETNPIYKTGTPADLSSKTIKDYLSYTIDNTWTSLTDKDGKPISDVYYQVVNTSQTDTKLKVLRDDAVTVKSTVTKEMMNAIDQNPTITFKAYAVQYSDTEKTNFKPYAAWEQIPSNE